jgi:acetyl-CoA/propionyl-CoA carboxylase biotin carboxyl carrier protein
MIRALEELEIAGVPTTRDFQLRVLRSPAWRESQPTTTFLDRNPQLLPSAVAAAPDQDAIATESTTVIAEVDGRRFQVRLHGAKENALPIGVPASRRPAPPASNGQRRDAAGHTLRSPIQGTVVRLSVASGEQVTRGQTICVVEAMKMENDVAAHRAGVVTGLSATPGMAVRVGDALAEIG